MVSPDFLLSRTCGRASGTTTSLRKRLRLAFDPIHGLSGTVGAFYSRTRNKAMGTPTYANGLVAATADNAVVGPWPNELLWSDTIGLIQEDYSIFGELYYKLSERWNLTLGARQYWLKQAADYTADGFINFGPTPDVPVNNRESGLSPKVALSYQATDDVMVYSSASKGFRAGGAQTFAPFCAEPDLPVTALTHLKSDTLWSYEVGTKVQVPNPGLLITAAAFHIKWNNLQQQVALPCGAYYTINGDEATINGGELEVSGHVLKSLQLRLGLGYEKTDNTDPGALGIVGVTPGTRILGVPAWSASLGGVLYEAYRPWSRRVHIRRLQLHGRQHQPAQQRWRHVRNPALLLAGQLEIRNRTRRHAGVPQRQESDERQAQSGRHRI